MESSKTKMSEMKDMVRNTLLRVVNTISGCYGGEKPGKFTRYRKLYNLESALGDLEEEKETWKSNQNVADFKEG